MRGLFSFNRNQIIILFTLLFVLVLGVLYYFMYVPNNQREIEKQRFKCLQNFEENVNAKKDNSVSLLNNLLNECISNPKGYPQVFSYANNNPHKYFKLKLSAYPSKNTIDSATCIELDDDSITITLTKKRFSGTISYTIQQFFAPLLQNEKFNQYILFNNGKVIYQTFPAGITGVPPDSLKTDKNALLNRSIRSVKLGGIPYKLFAQQFQLSNVTSLTITGLLANKNYSREKAELPEPIVLFLSIIALIGLLSLPWLKIFQMGSKDRLVAADGIACFMVAMLLMSILVLVFFNYNFAFRPGAPASEKIKRNLADSIEKRFRSGVEDAYAILDKAEKSLPAKKVGNDYRQFDGVINANTGSIRVKQIFTLDAKGNQTWLSDMHSYCPAAVTYIPRGNYANRDYFIKVSKGNLYSLDTSGLKQYYLDQVFSWTDGEFTSVLSKKSAKGIFAVSFNFNCLEKPVLTPGFSFGIISEDGRVLYHSNPDKDLHEKLFDELAEPEKLQAAISVQDELIFDSKYNGRKYNIYARPFKGCPYYIVIFEDASFSNIRDINTIGSSLLMQFVFFLILALVVIVVFFVSIKNKYFRKHYFDTSWLGPDSRFHKQYYRLFIINLMIAGLLIVSYFLTGFISMFFILLSASLISVLLQNILYKQVYVSAKDKEGSRLKQNAITALVLIILIIHIVADACDSRSLGGLLLFEAALLIILALVFKYVLTQDTDIIKEEEQTDALGIMQLKRKIASRFSYKYSLMFFSRMVITSCIPFAVFYIYNYNYEIKLVSRYRQANFISQLIDKSNCRDFLKDSSNVYADGIWVKNYNTRDTFKTANKDGLMAAVFQQLTVYNNDSLRGINQLNHNLNSLWRFNSLADRKSITAFHKVNNQYIGADSEVIQYNLPILFSCHDWFRGLSYWLLFAGCMYVFWLSLHMLIKKLFALNIPDEAGWDKLDNVLLSDNSLNNLLFIIGSHGSGKLKKIKELIDKGIITGNSISGSNPLTICNDPGTGTSNYYIADFIHIPIDETDEDSNKAWKKVNEEALKPKYALVIIDHFEYDIKNQASNRFKLNFIEDLLQQGKSKIIIISTVHPVNFLDSLNNQEKEKDATKRLPEHDLERWHVLLGYFKIAVEKLESEKAAATQTVATWEKELIAETHYSHFLRKLRKPFTDALSDLCNTEHLLPGSEGLSYKLGITSHYFYMYMWQSLTKEEKFILYDLAEDGLVNSYDDYNLILLISKGLIIDEHGVLKLFNNSFRNFILTAIGSSEAMAIRNQISDNGNWSKLKVPFIIIIVAVLTFLFASQQEIYSNLIKYLTAITVGVPAVLKLLSFFNGEPSKTTN